MHEKVIETKHIDLKYKDDALINKITSNTEALCTYDFTWWQTAYLCNAAFPFKHSTFTTISPNHYFLAYLLRYLVTAMPTLSWDTRTTLFMAGVMEGYADGQLYDAHEFLLHCLRQFECDSRYVSSFFCYTAVQGLHMGDSMHVFANSLITKWHQLLLMSYLLVVDMFFLDNIWTWAVLHSCCHGPKPIQVAL